MHLDYFNAFSDPQIRRVVANTPKLHDRFEKHGVFSALYEFSDNQTER